jgi:hypothetical protein
MNCMSPGERLEDPARAVEIDVVESCGKADLAGGVDTCCGSGVRFGREAHAGKTCHFGSAAESTGSESRATIAASQIRCRNAAEAPRATRQLKAATARIRMLLRAASRITGAMASVTRMK